MMYFALIVIGILAGLLGGLIGTGGCSVMLPILHFGFRVGTPTAIGTTLFAVIFTAASGAWGHFAKRNLDLRATRWLGGGGLLGVLLGSWVFSYVAKSHVPVLDLVLGVVFLWPAVRMLWEGLFRRTAPKGEGTQIPGGRIAKFVFGSIIGIATGIVGLGGGYALVPGLIYLFGAPVYVTMGTSLAVMVPMAVVGGGVKLVQGFVDLPAGIALGAGAVVGAQIGARAIKRFRPATLKAIFGVYFLYVSLKYILVYFGIRA
jgi:uncharacterized membrane protein YfcA